jgi:nitroreductase/NAD-dependent dihydropyrimidine dehydrogenase PreA subunit
MMDMITIDRSLCIKDGLCAKVCPRNIFIQREKLTDPELVNVEYCIACGQCLAICSKDAIRHTAFSTGVIRKIQSELLPSSEQVMELIKTRRSIRAFRDKPLEKATIEKIIEGARFAPSGHNAQSTEFLVIQDRDLLDQVSEMVVEYLRFEIGRFGNPIFRSFALLANRESAESGLHEIPRFKQLAAQFESGEDPILRGAPALLVFHASETVGFADVNAQLAVQNASMIAHSMGIGHFFTGWVLAPCRAPKAQAWNHRIPDLLGIPQGNQIFGALALGYPIPRFKKRIERESPPIRWA